MPTSFITTTAPGPETTGLDCALREAGTALAGLASLGEPHAIAARFRQMGVRGKRHSAMSCPVAQVVHKAVNKACRGDYDVTIGMRSSHLRVTGSFGALGGLETPAVVGEFIRLFDAGRFPDLETREPWESLG